MHLYFLRELFRQYESEFREEKGVEYAIIRHSEFEDYIEVNYCSDDYYTYWVGFATQHIDTSSKDEVIDFITEIIDAKLAAIEFFNGEMRRFGGSIATSKLDNITYDELRSHFGYQYYDISNLTFKVRAWDKKYCFNGRFEADKNIIKEFV